MAPGCVDFLRPLEHNTPDSPGCCALSRPGQARCSTPQMRHSTPTPREALVDQTTLIIALLSFIGGMCTALSFNRR